MTNLGIPHPAVPYGSTVVVTGASGLIGSHVVDKRSRRDIRYGAGSVDIVEIADLEAALHTFNEEAVERCKQPDPPGETVYAASKVAAERAIEQWVRDNKPSLVVNTLQPDANIGPLINSVKQGYPTSARWLQALWNKDYESLKTATPQHYINVQDDVRLHIVALAHPDVQRERIFAITAPVSMQDIVIILRKLHPSRQWDDFPNNDKDLSIVEPSKRAEALLRETYGSGFIGLEESVRGNA